MRLHRRKAIAFLPFPSWQSQRDPDPRRPCRLPAYRILSPAFVSANLLMCWSSFEAIWKLCLELV